MLTVAPRAWAEPSRSLTRGTPLCPFSFMCTFSVAVAMSPWQCRHVAAVAYCMSAFRWEA